MVCKKKKWALPKFECRMRQFCVNQDPRITKRYVAAKNGETIKLKFAAYAKIVSPLPPLTLTVTKLFNPKRKDVANKNTMKRTVQIHKPSPQMFQVNVELTHKVNKNTDRGQWYLLTYMNTGSGFLVMCGEYFMLDIVNVQNGGWSKWSPWSSPDAQCWKCSKSPNLFRERVCNNPAPKGPGAKKCPGSPKETKPCPSLKPCFHWSPWGACNCATKKKERKAICPPKVTTDFCKLPNPKQEFNPCKPSECAAPTPVVVAAPWGQWSSCMCSEGFKVSAFTLIC